MMKKLSVKILVTLALVLCAGLSSFATTYTWSRYKLAFEVPDNGFVTYQSNTRFEIQWEDMMVTIQLYSQQKGEKDQTYKDNLKRIAEQFSMYDTKEGKVKVKGFKGFQLEGTMPDGTRGLITNLISKKSELIVQVTINYLFGNREQADEVVKSFAEDEKPKAEKQRKQKVQSESDAKKEQEEKKKSTVKREVFHI